MLFFAWFGCNSSLAAFCTKELVAAADTLGVHITLRECSPWLCENSSSSFSSSSLFCVFDAVSVTVAQQISGRCVLLRAVYLLIGAASSVDDLLECIGSAPDKSSAEGLWLRGLTWPHEEFRPSDCTLRVQTIGRHYTLAEKTALTARVCTLLHLSPDTTTSPLPTEQRSHCISVMIEHALENAPAGAPQSWLPKGRVLRVFCGILVGESNRQRLLATYDLKRRPYIGTTSMPPEPAFVMVHMANVRRGMYILDPFCGTGSILVAAAHYGAVTLGADADGRVMQRGSLRYRASKQLQQQQVAMQCITQETLESTGITAEEVEAPSMWTNFKLYGLTSPDRVRLNFASWRSALRPCSMNYEGKLGPDHKKNDGGFLDAIVTDPPYGIREPRKKAAEVQKDRPQGERGAAEESMSYPVSSIVLDLMLFAAESLVLGGRLVLWYPTTTCYTDDELPTHPSLSLVCNIPQRISIKIVRHLIVMEKTQPVPFPAPTREMCAATRQPQDLRALMDATDLPDSADYTHYRSKVMKKRDAAMRYLAAVASPTCRHDDPSGGGDGDASNGNSGLSETRGGRRKMTKAERQELIVGNRERNLQKRQQQQQQQKKLGGSEVEKEEDDHKCYGNEGN